MKTKRELALISLNKKLAKREKQFNKLWNGIVKDVNFFVEKQGDAQIFYSVKEAEKLTDSLCLGGAWIADRIEGKTGNPYAKEYRGSLTKKIRKALGYNL